MLAEAFFKQDLSLNYKRRNNKSLYRNMKIIIQTLRKEALKWQRFQNGCKEKHTKTLLERLLEKQTAQGMELHANNCVKGILMKYII
jgi:hypothetical protein